MKSEIKKKGVRKILSLLKHPNLRGKKYEETVNSVYSHYKKFYNIDLFDGEYFSGRIG